MILQEKYGDNITDILEISILNYSNNISNTNRFLTPNISYQLFSKEMCNAIIEECQPFWNDDINELSIRSNHNISSIAHHALDCVIKKIQKIYNLHPDFEIKLDDYKLVRYTNTTDTNYYKDKSMITMTIHLSDPNDYVEDNTDYFNQGDLLLTLGKIPKQNPIIQEGIKYCLVGYIQFHIDDFDIISI